MQKFKVGDIVEYLALPRHGIGDEWLAAEGSIGIVRTFHDNHFFEVEWLVGLSWVPRGKADNWFRCYYPEKFKVICHAEDADSFTFPSLSTNP